MDFKNRDSPKKDLIPNFLINYRNQEFDQLVKYLIIEIA